MKFWQLYPVSMISMYREHVGQQSSEKACENQSELQTSMNTDNISKTCTIQWRSPLQHAEQEQKKHIGQDQAKTVEINTRRSIILEKAVRVEGPVNPKLHICSFWFSHLGCVCRRITHVKWKLRIGKSSSYPSLFLPENVSYIIKGP